MVTCGLIGAAGSFLCVAFVVARLEHWNAQERRRYARDVAAYKERLEQAHRRYAEAYATYLPKWQRWHNAYRDYARSMSNFRTWEQDHAAALAALRPRVQKAVQDFEVMHLNVDKRARLELELASQEHRLRLFREVFAEAAKRQPDFGLFRWLDTNRDFAAKFPELLALHGDPRLAAVREHLPTLSPIPKVLSEQVSRPVAPQRPEAPSNLIFWQNGGIEAAPVPPDKVTITLD